jgi:hypothetical protein
MVAGDESGRMQDVVVVSMSSVDETLMIAQSLYGSQHFAMVRPTLVDCYISTKKTERYCHLKIYPREDR